MDKDLEFWVYYLTMTEMQEDWVDPVDPGCLKPVEVVKAAVVLNDPADNLCIGAYGKDGKFYQFDSYEGYHSHEFFQKDFVQYSFLPVFLLRKLVQKLQFRSFPLMYRTID